jgi:formylglycine-generating enzyme required for sulfatase activity
MLIPLVTSLLSRLSCGLFVLALLMALPAHAQKRVAFVVGNAAYQNEKTLTNPINDAKLIARTLKTDLGFTDVIERQNLTRDKLFDLVQEIERMARGADAVVVYYSGHGMKGPGGNYLIPVDARIQETSHIRRDAIPAKDITDALSNSGARVALLILDACRDNPYGARTKSGDKGLARISLSGGNVLVAYATNEDNVAKDGDGANSPYATALAAALKLRDQPVLAQFDQVARAVRQATGNVQKPTRDGDLEVNVYLINPTITINNNASTSQPSNQRDAEEEAYKAAIAADAVEGYEQYLRDFEKGRNASAVKIRLAAAKRRETQVSQPALSVPATHPTQPLSSEAAVARRRGEVFRDCTDCPELVVIPAGSFTMGSGASEQALAKAAGMNDERVGRESPQHTVNVKSFAAGRFAVTRRDFGAFVQSKGYKTEAELGGGCVVYTNKWEMQADKNWRNVGFSQGDDHPVVCVSWNDAQAYVQWLSEKSGRGYRLLTEAEREYAARGGTTTAFWWGDSIGVGQANYDGNYAYNGSAKGAWRQATVAVNSFSANPIGLYNVHGNVWEWVEDCFHDNYSGAPTDGSAWTTGCSGDTRRVLRGGSWFNVPGYLRSADRDRYTPVIRISFVGFRIARTF